jgi:hypothetical protein
MGLLFAGFLVPECMEYALFCTSDFASVSAEALPFSPPATLSA